MPKLHITEYSRQLARKTVCIACREGILRDHFNDIISDIKFLNRYHIPTILFHNMSHRFANQKHFRTLNFRLKDSRIFRVPSDVDFYRYVLEYPYSKRINKLIFLERKYLIDHRGQKINTLTTHKTRETINSFGDLIANANFKDAIVQICRKIDEGTFERVHILPAGKHTIKHELFSLEGSGTMIANNFSESFAPVMTKAEVDIISCILDIYKRYGFLKPRSRQYIEEHRKNFYLVRIDGIVVGCVEKKIIDVRTVEIGALAISTKFRNQRVGVFTVKAFINEMVSKGYNRFISLTNNPRLEALYRMLGFQKKSLPEYQDRQKQSPDVQMFFKEVV
jgi:N-acetylglutamate synthase-like GNAT family acetyltransferase